MDAGVFNDTIQKMQAVCSAIYAYMTTSRKLTNATSTSVYYLIKETLQQFLHMIEEEFDRIWYNNPIPVFHVDCGA